MRGCVKRVVISVALALMAGVVVVSCTKMNENLGSELMPRDQVMGYGSAVLNQVNTYMTAYDSIPTGALGKMMLGRVKSADLGVTTYSGVYQYVPSSFNKYNYEKKEGYFFGEHTVVDSMMITLVINKIYGKSDVEQKFYMYEIDEDIYRDSIYYSNFDAESIVDRTKPLFSFTIKDVEAGDVFVARLKRESAANDYLERLITLDDSVYMQVDTVFRGVFKGFYISPSNNFAESPEDGAVYDFSPMSEYGTSYNFFSFHGYSLYGEDETENTPLTRRDTLRIGYTFDDAKDYVAYPNMSIATIKHDYTGAVIDPTTDFIPKLTKENVDSVSALPSVDRVYVQGGMGVSSYLNFTQEFVDELLDRRIKDGEEYVLMINRAMIYVWMDDAVVEKMNDAPERMGMYYSLTSSVPTNIPDYMYIEEAYYDYESAYKGYLNRTHGYYEMDVSMFIRKMVDEAQKQSEKAELKRWIYLAPGMTTDLFYSPKEVAIKNNQSGTDRDRVMVEVWYTLLKKK